MRISNFHVGLGLVTVSGCLWFLAAPPFDASPLAWIAAVPMLFAIDRAASFRRALLLGWWAGFVETAGGFYWLIEVMQRFAGLPWIVGLLVLVLFSASRALIFLFFTGIVRGIRRWRGVPMTLLAPLGMAACEFAVPQLFPCGQWITQAWHPRVIQVAELTGPWGVTALLMMVNGALYDLLHAPRKARYAAAAAAVILVAALVFGAVRMRDVDELVARAPRLKVGLVQPNIAYTNDGQFSRRRDAAPADGPARPVEPVGAGRSAAAGVERGQLPRGAAARFQRRFSEGLGGDDSARHSACRSSSARTRYDAAHDDALQLRPAARPQRPHRRAATTRCACWPSANTCPASSTFPWLKKILPGGRRVSSRRAPGPH